MDIMHHHRHHHATSSALAAANSVAAAGNLFADGFGEFDMNGQRYAHFGGADMGSYDALPSYMPYEQPNQHMQGYPLFEEGFYNPPRSHAYPHSMELPYQHQYYSGGYQLGGGDFTPPPPPPQQAPMDLHRHPQVEVPAYTAPVPLPALVDASNRGSRDSGISSPEQWAAGNAAVPSPPNNYASPEQVYRPRVAMPNDYPNWEINVPGQEPYANMRYIGDEAASAAGIAGPYQAGEMILNHEQVYVQPGMNPEQEFFADRRSPLIMEERRERRRRSNSFEDDEEGMDGGRQGRRSICLWVFLRDLLIAPDQDEPPLLTWIDRERGIFKILLTEACARKWGTYKRNPTMNYEKLSRALRYYYDRQILTRVEGQRLIYRFGPKAKGWRVHEVEAAARRMNLEQQFDEEEEM